MQIPRPGGSWPTSMADTAQDVQVKYHVSIL